jgi:Lrp/AsnC family transcriptional regulator, regulator for asnA, asnC and gidA
MDQMDRQIVEQLRQDGRRSNVEISRTLGVSEGTVRKRIERLLADGALSIVGLANPATAGYETRTVILLTVSLPQVQEVARQLSALPEVLSVYVLTGGYDILLEAVFRSDQHLLSFLSEQLAAMPGIMASKTCHVPQVIKERANWLLPEPPSPTIMIVDDDPDFVEVTRMVLEAEGWGTRSAPSGQLALQALQADPADLVIMDMMMEGVLDGWDTARRIRAVPLLRDVPILVVSSIASTEYLGMVPTDDDLRIDNFLAKPVSPTQLLAEVRRLLKRR